MLCRIAGYLTLFEHYAKLAERLSDFLNALGAETLDFEQVFLFLPGQSADRPDIGVGKRVLGAGADVERFDAGLQHFRVHFTKSIEFFKQLGLIRRTFDLEEWIDRSYLDAAVRDLKLERHWPAFDAEGNPKRDA